MDAAARINITAECIAARAPNIVNKELEEPSVKDVNVYAAQTGGWIYEVWIGHRPVVVGWCHTRQAAEHEAFLA
jgi:hypothetical protein